MDYRKSDFYYELPEELIARYPLAERSASRLLLAAGAHCRDLTMRDFPALLAPNDLLIFNNTKVMAARLLGQKDSGGRAEILVERILSPTEALAQVGASKRPRPGTAILIDGQPVQVLAKEGDLYRLQTAHWPQLRPAAHSPLLSPARRRTGQAALPDHLRQGAGRSGGADGGAALRRGFTGGPG